MTAEGFWRRVDKTGDCWLWTGSRYKYGLAYLGSRPMGAHRVAWILTHGPIEGRLYVCHRCDNPLCVRPDHLFLGTQTDNMRDCSAKGRQGNHAVPVESRRFGERNPRAKLTAQIAREIRIRSLTGERSREIAASYGVSSACVRNVVKGKTWAEVG